MTKCSAGMPSKIRAEKNITIYKKASNSKVKWRTLIGWFLVEILRYVRLPWKRSVSAFFLSPGKFKFSETQKF